MDAGGRVIDVGDGTGGRYRLQVLVVQAVHHHRLAQCQPLFAAWDGDIGVGEQRANPFGLGLPFPFGVFAEVFT
ncbi:hypothetical protein D3C78_1376320 [compost metagenome]